MLLDGWVRQVGQKGLDSVLGRSSRWSARRNAHTGPGVYRAACPPSGGYLGRQWGGQNLKMIGRCVMREVRLLDTERALRNCCINCWPNGVWWPIWTNRFRSCAVRPYSEFMCFKTPVVTIFTTSLRPYKFYVLPTQLYLCVLCGSQNKQRLFPYTTLTDWFLQLRRSVFTARYGLGIYI